MDSLNADNPSENALWKPLFVYCSILIEGYGRTPITP